MEASFKNYSDQDLNILDHLLKSRWDSAIKEAIQHQFVHNAYQTHHNYQQLIETFHSDHCRICNPIKENNLPSYQKFIKELGKIGIRPIESESLYLKFKDFIKETKAYQYKIVIQQLLENLAIRDYPKKPSDLARPLLRLLAQARRYTSLTFQGIQIQIAVSTKKDKAYCKEVTEENLRLEREATDTSTI